jgi:hypothetical protein
MLPGFYETFAAPALAFKNLILSLLRTIPPPPPPTENGATYPLLFTIDFVDLID